MFLYIYKTQRFPVKLITRELLIWLSCGFLSHLDFSLCLIKYQGIKLIQISLNKNILIKLCISVKILQIFCPNFFSSVTFLLILLVFLTIDTADKSYKTTVGKVFHWPVTTVWLSFRNTSGWNRFFCSLPFILSSTIRSRHVVMFLLFL